MRKSSILHSVLVVLLQLGGIYGYLYVILTSMDMYEPLAREDIEETLEFVARRPEYNVVLIHNMNAFGMDRGESPFQGDYFGRREDGRLVSAGCRYNLGSMFFDSLERVYVGGMGAYLLGLGVLPAYLAGDREQLEVVLLELEAGGVEVRREPARFMVLREPRPVPEAGVPRDARPGDVDAIVEMAAMFETELFGAESIVTDAARELIAAQMERGIACVVEEDGRIVSKAEATVARGAGSQVGGVFTLPEFRGRGYSTACMSFLARRCLETAPGCSLTVHEENYPAVSVYHRIGFTDVAEWLIATLETS